MKGYLLLLAVAQVVRGQTVTYRCAPQNYQNWPAGACVVLDPSSNANNQIYDVMPCTDPNSSYCPIGGAVTYPVMCAPATAAAMPYGTMPGNYCRSNGDCKSNNCVMGFCEGAANGCTTNVDCGPGSYCANQVCTALVAVGQACNAGEDEMCAMNSGCSQGVCTAYYSVENGKAVDDCIQGPFPNYSNFPNAGVANIYYSKYCQSGTCDSTGKTCVAAMATSSAQTPLPITCTVGAQNQQCVSSNGQGGLTGNTNCMSGKNANAQDYCNPDMGDLPYQTFINWITGEYMPLVAANNFCHTTQRNLDPNCLMLLGGMNMTNSVNTLTNYVANYGTYVGSDYCTKMVYNAATLTPYQFVKFCGTSFSCASNTTTGFSNPVGCIAENFDAKTFQVRPCTDFSQSYCNYFHGYMLHAANEMNCTAPSTTIAPVTGNYPGDLCTMNSGCWSNSCVNGVCTGQVSGGTCNSDLDCSPGYFCSLAAGNNVCTQLKAIGTSCTATQQCVMNAACNIDPATGAGSCTQYYNVQAGATVSDCGLTTFLQSGGQSTNVLMGGGRYLQYSAMCASGTCTLNANQAANMGTCVAAYKMVSEATPYTCTFKKTDCAVSNGDAQTGTYTTCGCGRSSGTSYCMPELGDAPFTALLNWVTGTYLLKISNTQNCHTYRRGLDTVCMQNMENGGMNMTMAFNQLWYAATHYQVIQDSPDCVQQVFVPEYWSAVHYLKSYTYEHKDAGWWLALSSGLFVVLS